MNFAFIAIVYGFFSTALASGPQAHFNYNQDSSYLDPYRKIMRKGDNLEQVAISFIRGAKKELKIAVQELSLPLLAQEIVLAKRRGVIVQLLIEHDYNHLFKLLSDEEISKMSKRSQARYYERLKFLDLNNDLDISREERESRESLTILKKGGVELRDDESAGKKNSGLMHHKFIIRDQKDVLASSANFTLSGVHGDYTAPLSRGNHNAMVTMAHKGLSKAFSQEFNTIWNGKAGRKKPLTKAMWFKVGSKKIGLKFSPGQKKNKGSVEKDSTTAFIINALSKAKTKVQAALFVFSHQSLADALLGAAKDGADIEVLGDPRFAFRAYSELLDLWGVTSVNRWCRYEADNLLWPKGLAKVGIPKLNQGDLLHHKFAVIDRKQVLFGSHNWSDAADYSNDEFILLIEDQNIAESFNKAFDGLSQTASWGLPPWLPRKIEERRRKYCQ